MFSFDQMISPFSVFIESDKRLFYVYLISAFVLGVVILFYKERSVSKSLNSFFNKKILFHPSTRVDMSLFVFNIFFKILIFTFVTFTAVKVSQSLNSFLYDLFPDHQKFVLSYSQLMLVYSIVSFVVLDFSRFFQHYLFHKVPFLWRFHKVHHSARVLTPLTLYRTHPFESLVGSVRRIVILGGLAGLFSFLTQSMIGVYAILGVNAFDFIFNVFGSNLRHSHIWLSFGPLNYIFMSPAQHQVHHSRDRKYFDTNLGVVFSFWDQLFGTFYHPKKKEFISFGVRGSDHKSFKEALFEPFQKRIL